MRLPLRAILFFLALLAALQCDLESVHTARAESPDVLFLTNGDRLSGQGNGIHDGMLNWQLDVGMVLDVPIEKVERIELVPLTPSGNANVDPNPFGTAESSPGTPQIGKGRIVDTEETEGEVVRYRWDRAFSVFGDWTKRIELGARLLDGNTNDDFLNIDLIFERKWNGKFAQLDTGGLYGQSNGERSTNRWFLNSTIDFDRDGNWILFVTGNNLYDEFENLDYRGSFSGGIGYEFFKEKYKRLIFRIGPGVTHEIYDDPVTHRTTADVFAELESIWPLTKRMQFENKTTVYPNIRDVQIFRYTANTGLLIRIDDEERWRLRLGSLIRYNSRPNKNRDTTDFTSTVSLVYTRK